MKTLLKITALTAILLILAGGMVSCKKDKPNPCYTQITACEHLQICISDDGWITSPKRLVDIVDDIIRFRRSYPIVYFFEYDGQHYIYADNRQGRPTVLFLGIIPEFYYCTGEPIVKDIFLRTDEETSLWVALLAHTHQLIITNQLDQHLIWRRPQ